jgi:hypothetical protein
MWEFKHTETTPATPAQLWGRYIDHASWPEWDTDTESVTLDGPFVAGTTGTIKPVGAPKAKFRVAEVTEDVSFIDVSKLPFAKMQFAHMIEPADGGTRFTHHVTISGPLSPLFGRVIGKKVAAGLPSAMRRLGELAEREPC